MEAKSASSSLILRIITAVILLYTFSSGIALYFLKIDLIDLCSKIPLCFFHFVTGMPCPFCGMSRAFLALGQLNLPKAMHFHPLSLAALAVMIIYLCCKKIPRWLQHKAWAYLFLFATIITWALRLANHSLH